MDDLNAATRTLRYTKDAEISGDPLLHVAWISFFVTLCMGCLLLQNWSPKHVSGKGKAVFSKKGHKASDIKPVCKENQEDRRLKSAPEEAGRLIPSRVAPLPVAPVAVALEKRTVAFVPNDQREAEHVLECHSEIASISSVSVHELHDAYATESLNVDWETEPRCTDHASWMKGADHGLTPTRSLLLPASALSCYGYSLSRGPAGCSMLEVPWSIPKASTPGLLVPIGKSPSLMAKTESKSTALQYLEDLGFSSPDEPEEWQESCSCNRDACISCLRQALDSPNKQPEKEQILDEKQQIAKRRAATVAADAAYMKRYSLSQHNHDALKSFLRASS